MAERKNLGKLEDVLAVPNLIKIQVDSYKDFLQQDVKPEDRKDQGLQELFNSNFPMPSLDDKKSATKKKRVHFVSYRIGEAQHNVIECLKDGYSYQAPLYATFKVEDTETGIIGPEEEVQMAEIPLMTPAGSFVINGAERVLVSQLHRSPGICFEKERNNNGKDIYSFRIIPDRGSWMEVYFDQSERMTLSLDRKKGTKKKCLLTTFLRAIGYGSDEEMLRNAYRCETIKISKFKKDKKEKTAKEFEEQLNNYYTIDTVKSASGKTIVDKRFTALTADLLGAIEKAGIKELPLIFVPNGANYLMMSLEKDDAKDKKSALNRISQKIRSAAVESSDEKQDEEIVKKQFFNSRYFNLGRVGRYKLNQLLREEYLAMDTEFFDSVYNMSEEEASHSNADYVKCIRSISKADYKKMTDEQKKIPCADQRGLDPRDLMAATRRLMVIYSNKADADDIDHLGARRVRPVGELFQSRCQDGFSRLSKNVSDTLQQNGDKDLNAVRLLNPKTFMTLVRDFFARNQLSQFMDQTNPLSEITNKRRLSALGPGGLNRERAGYEVRDVHTSHYGRICPIETPEGPNIGLITSLALYARVNSLGFIETPYRKVVKGIVSNKVEDVEYLTADQEEQYVIAQANAPLTDDLHFKNPMVMCRYKGESEEHPREDVNYMDISPKQLVSAAAGLIPFLEHDDANRALMGSNMQRQAVPLMVTEAPFVGTGLERQIARDSNATILARKDGIVADINVFDNNTRVEIITTTDGEGLTTTKDPDPEIYDLVKFMRTNSSTSINQRPYVKIGQQVKVGDVIADGASTKDGELALGKNLLAAYMPWCGYNFEDAIVLSERMVKEDVYTSVHVETFEAICRDTKNGPEEITADIMNAGDKLNNLGPNGVVRLGTEVKPGDMLVGKISPQGEIDGSPEEKLLREIFQTSAKESKDTSLTVPGGKGGIVMDVRIEYQQESKQQKIISNRNIKQRRKDIEEEYKDKRAEVKATLVQRLTDIYKRQNNSKTPVDIYEITEDGEKIIFIKQNHKMSQPMIKKLADHYDNYGMDECDFKFEIDTVMKEASPKFQQMEKDRRKELDDLESGKASNKGCKIKRVTVYVASKRKIQVGDKMAGRHGNKGIVSRIVPIADMPFMPDGRPVDIVLNPLGVPSRMNIGQILETHLGMAARMLGIKVATPVFDGAQEKQIIDMMKEGNLKVEKEKGENFHWGFKPAKKEDWDEWDAETKSWKHGNAPIDFWEDGGQVWKFDGKTDLYDGRTGNKFDQRITVGVAYMLKLDHLVANKIHARATGPYSLVTQQPLGGKAQQGGQRFGEMEVWALEAYGAAHTLQEMLTVKSDDRSGRTRVYDSIVRGTELLEPGRPESFNVLLSEMKGLGYNVEAVSTENKHSDDKNNAGNSDKN